AGRQRHPRRLQRRALLRGCRGALFLRRHVSDATPDRRQGGHRVQRLRVSKGEPSEPANRVPQHRRRVHMATAIAVKEVRHPKPLPAPNSDFYQFAETLSADELAILKRVRAFMDSKVAPIINKYWVEDAFPFELLPAFKELNLGGLGTQGYGCAGGSQLL